MKGNKVLQFWLVTCDCNGKVWQELVKKGKVGSGSWLKKERYHHEEVSAAAARGSCHRAPTVRKQRGGHCLPLISFLSLHPWVMLLPTFRVSLSSSLTQPRNILTDVPRGLSPKSFQILWSWQSVFPSQIRPWNHFRDTWRKDEI